VYKITALHTIELTSYDGEHRETTGIAIDSVTILKKIHNTNACEFLSFNFQMLESNPRRVLLLVMDAESSMAVVIFIRSSESP